MIVIVDSRKLMVSTSGLQIPLQSTPSPHQKTFLVAETWKHRGLKLQFGCCSKKSCAKVIFVLGQFIHWSSPVPPPPDGNHQISQRNEQKGLCRSLCKLDLLPQCVGPDGSTAWLWLPSEDPQVQVWGETPWERSTSQGCQPAHRGTRWCAGHIPFCHNWLQEVTNISSEKSVLVTLQAVVSPHETPIAKTTQGPWPPVVALKLKYRVAFRNVDQLPVAGGKITIQPSKSSSFP